MHIDLTIMHHCNPMDIPELRLMAAQHLSGSDLKSCALVCKAWHETFTSCLWSKFVASHERCYNYGKSSNTNGERDAIINNSYRIRDLQLDFVCEINETRRLLELFVSNCTSLVAFSYNLAFSGEGIPKEISNDDLVQELIVLNPKLRELSISTISCLQPLQLSVLSNLRILEIRIALSVQDATFILAALPSLHDLTLYQSFCTLSRISPSTGDGDHKQLSSSSLSSPSSSSSLRRLILVYATDISDLAQLLKHCPNIRHLCFKNIRSAHHGAIGVLQPGLLPHLNSLSLDNIHGGADNPMILKALRSHSVSCFKFGNTSHNTLLSIAQYHARHVEHLSLTIFAPEGRSLMVILTQCASLRILKVHLVKHSYGRIDLRCLIGEPWNCTMLEELVLPVTLDRKCEEASLKSIVADEKEELAKTSKMAEWQQAEAVFMKRLGSLTRLRRLELKSRIKPKVKPPSEMSWRLTAGFGHLQHLDRLETLKLAFQEYVQGIHEFEWMKQHFKSLSTLVVYDMGSRKLEWMRVHWPELCVVELRFLNSI